MEQELEIRDHRNKEWFWVDDEYLNGYARLLKPAATLVYLSLCRHANNEQTSWPSIELLCKELGLSNKTVISAIVELEQWKIISVSRSKDPNSKRQNPNIYTLTHKRIWKPKPGVETTHGAGAECNSRPEPSVNDDQKPSVAITLEVNTTEVNTENQTHKRDDRDLEVQELWEYGQAIGFSLTKQHINRYAITRLIKAHGKDLAKKYAQYSQAVRQHQYAPQINNWMDLEEKLLKLRDFAERQKKKSQRIVNIDL